MSAKDNKSNSNKSISHKKQLIVGNDYEIGKKIGSGSFGQLRLGRNMSTKEKVAIKLEPQIQSRPLQLPLEYNFYRILGETEGLPKLYYFGPWDGYNAIVMDLLGKNLEDVFLMCDRKFQLKTVIYIALQVLERIEYVHNHNIIFRDIKPENFLLGLRGTPKANIIHLIDFGLAKEYIVDGQHLKLVSRDSITGTARYMSINAHMGLEQSRRDDMESIGHMLIYLLKEGRLPWMGLKARNVRERYKKICQRKRAVSIEVLCKDLPQLFFDYIKYCRELNFYQKPDYKLWKTKFIELFESNKFLDDGYFEWDFKKGLNWKSATNEQIVDKSKMRI